MASNDVEVLDPAASVENLKESESARELNRRHFFAALGVAGAAVGAALVSGSRAAVAQQPLPNGYAQVDVLNLMLQVKYLKATLYSYITQGTDLPPASFVTVGNGTIYNAPAKITFSSTQLTDLFNELYYDELEQLIALRNLQGVAVASRQTINILGNQTTTATTTLTQSQAIALARMLEDLSVTAFAGAAIYLSGANLEFAAQALASDGFHAGALRLVCIQQGIQYLSTQTGENPSTTTATPITFTGSTTTGSNTIYAILGTAPAVPVVGQILSGIGIPPGAGAVITSITNNASKTPTGIVVKGSTTINTVSSVSGVLVGQPISGTYIPANSYITAVGANSITINGTAGASTSSQVTPTGILTNGSTVISGVSSVSGLLVGQPITGTGIPTGTTIAAVSSSSASPLTITMSAASTSSPVVTPKGVVTSGSAFILAVSSTSGLVVGQPITGTGIPAGTTIAAVGTGEVTMSGNASASTPVTATFTGVTTSGSTVITGVSSLSGLVAGALLTGAGIAFNTTISSVGNVIFTAFTTSGSNVLTTVSNFIGLSVGQSVTGTGIPSGTTITAISASAATVTMSANATATITTAENVTCPSTTAVTMSAVATATSATAFTGITTSGSANITSASSISGLAVGQTLNGTGIPSGATIASILGSTVTMSAPATATITTAEPIIASPTTEAITSTTPVALSSPTTETVTSPTTEALSIGASQITIAGNATVTGVNTIGILLSDNFDVEPGDPGTAALSAAGPQALSGTSPTMYQGFFNTAGAATSSANVPPGFAFTRTFQQVLAVLYQYNSTTSTTTNNTVTTQNYEGGFYPVGVSGQINSVT